MLYLPIKRNNSKKITNLHSYFIIQKDNLLKSKSFKKKKKQSKKIDQIFTKKISNKNLYQTCTHSQKSSLEKKLSSFNSKQHLKKNGKYPNTTTQNLKRNQNYPYTVTQNLKKNKNYPYTATCSVQNEKMVSQKPKSREKSKTNLKTKSLKVLKSLKCLKSLKGFKCLKKAIQLKLPNQNQDLSNKFIKNTSVEQNINQKNKKKASNIHTSLQQQRKNSKSRNKTLNPKRNQRDKSKITKKPSEIKITKSNYISRDPSRNNSKQKQSVNTELNAKFKKTRLIGGLQKKVKKINAYSSMKISPRNSFRFIQTQSHQFHVLNQRNNQKAQNFPNFGKIKQKTDDFKLKKIQSLRNINQKLQELLNCQSDDLQGSLEISEKRPNQFSFFKQNKKIKENVQHNPNLIQMDRSQEKINDDIQFSLVCEESLREKLNKIQQESLKRLKKEQQKAQYLESLNQFEKSLQNQRSFSTSQQLVDLTKNHQINFESFCQFDNKSYLKNRAQIVDWLSILSSQMLLKTQTFHLAIAYYDLYLSHQNHQSLLKINFADLKLIGLSCLIIAIKMEERQYEHQILNSFKKFQIPFTRQKILKKEIQIFKKINLNLKIQTLPFWVDYFSQKWDFFLINTKNPFHTNQKIFLRSIDGKSYENYRKIINTMNFILLQGGIFSYDFLDLTLSTIYLVLSQIVEMGFQQRIYKQINTFKNNLKEGLQNQNLKCAQFSTQDTLDQLSLNQLKENEFLSLQNNSNYEEICHKIDKEKTIKFSSRNQNSKGSKQKFIDFFNSFIEKYAKKDLSRLQKSIKYLEIFTLTKERFQMDQRVYQKAQSYEQFIRYHSYCTQSKKLVLKTYEDFQKPIQQNQFYQKKIQFNTIQQTDFSQTKNQNQPIFTNYSIKNTSLK